MPETTTSELSEYQLRVLATLDLALNIAVTFAAVGLLLLAIIAVRSMWSS